MKVFLAGEGRHELGGWAHERAYRSDRPETGVLTALLEKAAAGAFEVKDAVQWKDIRKINAGAFRSAEIRNVLGAALLAGESGCDVLAFTRDRDGDPDRESDIAAGIAQAEGIKIIGGVAIEQIESWVLSCRGVSRAESLTDSKQEAHRQLGGAGLSTLVAAIESADIERLPADAKSLRAWLGRAQAVAGIKAESDGQSV